MSLWLPIGFKPGLEHWLAELVALGAQTSEKQGEKSSDQTVACSLFRAHCGWAKVPTAMNGRGRLRATRKLEQLILRSGAAGQEIRC